MIFVAVGGGRGGCFSCYKRSIFETMDGRNEASELDVDRRGLGCENWGLLNMHLVQRPAVYLLTKPSLRYLGYLKVP